MNFWMSGFDFLQGEKNKNKSAKYDLPSNHWRCGEVPQLVERRLTSSWSRPRRPPGGRRRRGTRRWSPWRTCSWSRTWCSGWGSLGRRSRRVCLQSNTAWAGLSGLRRKRYVQVVLKNKDGGDVSPSTRFETHLYPKTGCVPACQTPGPRECPAGGRTRSPSSRQRAYTRACTGGKRPANVFNQLWRENK